MFFLLFIKTHICFFVASPAKWMGRVSIFLGRFLAKISPKQQQMNVLWTYQRLTMVQHVFFFFFPAFCDDVVYAMRCMQHHFMEVGCVDKNGRPQVIAICQLQGHRQHGWQAHNRMGEYYRVSILVGNIIWRFPTMRVPQIIQSSWMTSPLGLKQAMVTTGDPP